MDADRIDFILNCFKYGGLLVGALSGVLGTLTKTHVERPKRKLTGWGKVSVTLTFFGFLTAAGAQFIEGSRQRLQEAESRKEKKNNARAELELREKIQQVLVQLNAAKHEDSKKITEEKIRVLQKDFADWATNFVKNLPRIKTEFDRTRSDFEQGKLQAQIEQTKKQIQTSQQAFPLISFATRYVQEAVRAFSKQTGKEIKMAPLELPQNFFEKRIVYEIPLNTNAVWTFLIGVEGDPSLRIQFKDSHGNSSGQILLRTTPKNNKFSMIYEATVPTPDPKTVAGDREMADYETPIQEVFQRVIEAQLIQAFNL